MRIIPPEVAAQVEDMDKQKPTVVKVKPNLQRSATSMNVHEPGGTGAGAPSDITLQKRCTSLELQLDRWVGIAQLLASELAYREKRLSEREYLNSVVDLASKVARKDRGRDVPESIRGDEDAQAFFGVLDGQLKTKGDDSVTGVEVAAIAQQIIDIIKSHVIVDIWSNEVAQNNLRNAIDDYFFDVLRDEKDIDIPVEVLDDLELKIMDLARARFAA